MQIQKINKYFIGFLCFFTLLCSTSFAQTRPSFDIKTIPENYKPEEDVTITLSSFNFSLENASIEWEIDGESFKKGVGVTQIKTTAPQSGQIKEVYVIVKEKNTVIEKVFTLRPESIELYIESVDGYIPPWYKGRSHIAEESVVKVIAVPDSFDAIISDTTRSYSWLKNNFRDVRQSGRARQAFITKLSPFSNSETITVEVGGTSEAIVLRPRQTRVSIYEYSPLTGTRFEKELIGNLSLTKDDATFEMVPWFFSSANRLSSVLTVGWTINGLPTRAQGNRSLLNIRKSTSQSGRAEVGVTVKHKDRTLQSNQTVLTIDI